MDPISLGIGAATAGAAVVSAAAAVGTLAHSALKDYREEQRSATHTQSNQVAPFYNSYPVPQSENVAQYYRTSGTGRVTIGSDGRSISAGGSAPGDVTFGWSSRTTVYSSLTTGSGPSPNFNFNQSQTLPPQFPFFLMPPPQQQHGGFIQQQSQYGGNRPISPRGGYNGGQRVIEYAPSSQGEEEHNTFRRTQSFQR